MTASVALRAATFREHNRAGRLLMALPGAPAAEELFAAGAARISIGQMAMLATLGLLKRIGEELRTHGTWRSIESTFYGFAEAEALFSRDRVVKEVGAAVDR